MGEEVDVQVVCVHGIGKHTLGEQTLLAQWLPALRDGLTRADAAELVPEDQVAMAFYGDVFRPSSQRLAVGDPPYRPADVQPGLETDLLMAWWTEAARIEASVVAPHADTLIRTPGSVQVALRALSRSRFLAGMAVRAMISDLKQVSGYLIDADVRARVQARVATAIKRDTKVVVAHSLGTVVAYEALHAVFTERGHNVRAFITLGSPLGIRNLIFDRLHPPPIDGLGAWPGGESTVWTNLADAGDIVALVKDLRPRFGQQMHSIEVHNGVHAHDARPYLTEEATGAAIAEGLL
jgi:hypothetical protein